MFMIVENITHILCTSHTNTHSTHTQKKRKTKKVRKHYDQHSECTREHLVATIACIRVHMIATEAPESSTTIEEVGMMRQTVIKICNASVRHFNCTKMHNWPFNESWHAIEACVARATIEGEQRAHEESEKEYLNDMRAEVKVAVEGKECMMIRKKERWEKKMRIAEETKTLANWSLL